MKVELISVDETIEFGRRLGSLFHGGEVIELAGDVGAGKTTLTRGIALGMGIDQPIQSPTFTISRQYDARGGLRLVHYDFYRLKSAGIMRDELIEAISDRRAAIVLEWAALVEGVLPADRLTLNLLAVDEDSRRVILSAGGATSQRLLKEMV